MLSCVQFFATPWNVACQSPLSIGILRAGTLEWVAMRSSRGSSQPRDQTHVPCINRLTSNHWTTREALTGIFTVSINVENCVRPGIDSVLLESITENHTYRSRHMQIGSLKICREWLRTVIEPSHGLPCSCYIEQEQSIWFARLDF